MKGTKELGAQGEDLVIKYLEENGYGILERNVRFGRLEVDIIGQKGDLIVFFEVKARFSDSLAEAELALKNWQIQRLKRAMMLYSEEKGVDIDCLRLDFIAVFMNKKNKKASLRHFIDILG